MRTLALVLTACVVLAAAPEARADSAAEINKDVAASLKEFRDNTSPKVQRYINKAAGVLVFPSVVKAGIGIGGEYGEGALLVGGKTVDYYSVAGASVGFQLGAQSRAQFILFMTPKALADFRKAKGWKAGVDGSVALATVGTGGEVMTPDGKDHAVLGFVYGAKGLMYNLSFEGQKFTKIKP
jgi:lipid-binding SYLF domain-containing protein